MSKQRPQIPLTTSKRLGPRKSTSDVSRSLGYSPVAGQTSPEARPPIDSFGHAASPQIAPGVDETIPGDFSGTRKGSPFAAGTARKVTNDTATIGIFQILAGSTVASAVPLTDSPWGRSISGETANGATFAAWLIFPLSLLAITLFPAGTVIISLLGMVLALFGIASRWHRISLAALFTHLVCAGFAYSKIVA